MTNISQTNRDELFFELVEALRKYVEHSEEVSERLPCCEPIYEKARALLSKIEPETPKVKTR